MNRSDLIKQIASAAEQDLEKVAQTNKQTLSSHGVSESQGTNVFDLQKQNFPTENPSSVKQIPVEYPKTLSQRLVAKPMPQYESIHHINYQDDTMGKYQDPGLNIRTEKIVDTTMIKTASADELLGLLKEMSSELVKTAAQQDEEVEQFLLKVAYDTLEEVESLEKIASDLGRQAAEAFLAELGVI